MQTSRRVAASAALLVAVALGTGVTDAPAFAKQPCTKTSFFGKCIQAGDRCKKAKYGKRGWDAAGNTWVCKGKYRSPYWLPPKRRLQWPSNGSGSGVGWTTGDGCLEISVPAGRRAYYAKLGSGASSVWDAFIRPGTTRRFDVPVGTYDLTYGAGRTWYGWKYAFGPRGVYSEASETFNFGSGQCWQVELILQVSGNLDTDGIGYNQF